MKISGAQATACALTVCSSETEAQGALEFNSRRAVRPDLPLRGSLHESAGREGQTYFH